MPVINALFASMQHGCDAHHFCSLSSYTQQVIVTIINITLIIFVINIIIIIIAAIIINIVVIIIIIIVSEPKLLKPFAFLNGNQICTYPTLVINSLRSCRTFYDTRIQIPRTTQNRNSANRDCDCYHDTNGSNPRDSRKCPLPIGSRSRRIS